MSAQMRSRRYWFVLGPLAIVVIVLGTAWASQAAETQHRPRENQFNQLRAAEGNKSGGEKLGTYKGGTGVSGMRKSGSGGGEINRSGVGKSEIRKIESGGGVGSKGVIDKSGTGASGMRKSGSGGEINRSRVGKSEIRKIESGGGVGNKGVIDKSGAGVSGMRKSGSGSEINRSRLDKTGVDRLNAEAGGGAGRKSDGGIIVDNKTTTTLQSDRTKAADVRRRLGVQGHDAPAPISGQRGNDVTLPGKGSLELGQPKFVLPDPGRLVQPGGHSVSGGGVARDAKKTRFPDQLKAGELDRLTAGETAKKIKLADQYRLYQQGDVARRLGLQKHAQDAVHGKHATAVDRFQFNIDHGFTPHPNFHHGMVNPAYQRHCLQYRYWGPSFFAGPCWYPRWNPWVEWSWRYRCPAYWDPRPIWRRPVIYAPCPPWIYWETPVWAPLSVVSCGTWVDLRPVVVAAESDLQLVAVRFVDPGHPEEKLGPRYRVWFRNNGVQPIVQPFNVMLFAANGDRLSPDLPQAGVRVTAIEAGATQSIDIRLPMEVYTMGRDALGNPAPFSTLHVLIDANQETPEIVRTNNGARLIPAEILPVDPAAFELEPTTAKFGAEVILAGEGFGPEPGQILLHVGDKEMEGEILGWYDLGIRWTLPKAVISAPVEAEVIVIRGDGAAANPLKITIAPWSIMQHSIQ